MNTFNNAWVCWAPEEKSYVCHFEQMRIDSFRHSMIGKIPRSAQKNSLIQLSFPILLPARLTILGYTTWIWSLILHRLAWYQPRNLPPHVPISITEIVEQIHEAVEIGISMVHLHARDEKTGEPTYWREVYRDIIEGIRRFSRDLVVCVSLSGRTFKEFERRAEPLQIDGDLARISHGG